MILNYYLNINIKYNWYAEKWKSSSEAEHY